MRERLEPIVKSAIEKIREDGAVERSRQRSAWWTSVSATRQALGLGRMHDIETEDFAKLLSDPRSRADALSLLNQDLLIDNERSWWPRQSFRDLMVER